MTSGVALFVTRLLFRFFMFSFTLYIGRSGVGRGNMTTQRRHSVSIKTLLLNALSGESNAGLFSLGSWYQSTEMKILINDNSFPRVTLQSDLTGRKNNSHHIFTLEVIVSQWNKRWTVNAAAVDSILTQGN